MNPIGQVSQQMTMVMMALAGASRIFALMDEPSEQDNGTVTLVNVELASDGRTMTETPKKTGHWAWKREASDDGTRSREAAKRLSKRAAEVAEEAHEEAVTSADGRLTLLRGDVRFTDVTFGYNPDKPVLHDITWFAKPGQKIALVGATGAGKTTITNLINRFYDIQEGMILYDGINVKGIRKPDLRRSLGIVLQDVNLFTGTVMDNIRYGKLDATDDECIAAAKLVNADSFIRMLPDGYQTVLSGDGSGLSQGQRQLISIARAAVADPPALILDEATSSIDTRTEEAGPGRHGQPDEGTHGVRHRPPPVHGQELGCHHGARPRPHHRTRLARRAHGGKGRILPAVHWLARTRVAGPGKAKARPCAMHGRALVCAGRRARRFPYLRNRPQRAVMDSRQPVYQ